MKLPKLLIFLFPALWLLGCGGGSSSSGGAPASAPSGEGALTGEAEVAAFKGGYGTDFYEKAASEFEEKHPGLKISVWGNPRVWEQLRPRFIGGDPPDLTFPGWGMDHWTLVEEGQIMSLDTALDSKPFEGEGTWRDTFEPSLLALGQSDGKQWVLPYYFNVMGWWYDPAVFTKNGWAPPKDFDELLALCAKIKASGMAPITFQGQYPYYMMDGMLLPWAISIGGIEAVRDAQNLVPGAWKSSAMLEAAKRIDQLNKLGYLQQGAVSMSHTESQEEFLNGRAAMIPCGTWLYSEMKNVMPPAAQMEFMLPPVIRGGKGDPTAILIGIEPWMVPAEAKNPNAGVALFKYMTSLTKAKQFVEEKGTLMAIRGSDQAKLPPVLVQPARLFKQSKTVWSVEFRNWYPALNTEIMNAITAMLNGQITPEQLCERAETKAEETRKDDGIKKHKLAG